MGRIKLIIEYDGTNIMVRRSRLMATPFAELQQCIQRLTGERFRCCWRVEPMPASMLWAGSSLQYSSLIPSERWQYAQQCFTWRYQDIGQPGGSS